MSRVSFVYRVEGEVAVSVGDGEGVVVGKGGDSRHADLGVDLGPSCHYSAFLGVNNPSCVRFPFGALNH